MHTYVAGMYTYIHSAGMYTYIHTYVAYVYIYILRGGGAVQAVRRLEEMGYMPDVCMLTVADVC